MISAVGDNPEHAALPATAARSSMFSLAARSRSAKGGSGTKVQKQRRTAFEPSAGAFQGLPPENHAAAGGCGRRGSIFSLAARSRSAKGGSGTKVQKQYRTAFEPSAGAFQGLPPENHAAMGGCGRRGSMCKIEWNCYFSRIYPSSPDRISPAVCDSVCHRLLLYPSG